MKRQRVGEFQNLPKHQRTLTGTRKLFDAMFSSSASLRKELPELEMNEAEAEASD
jgi:hypothetical protein